MIEPNPPIYFIRHGETDWNREGRIQGQIDIPLNDNGHQQAIAISRGLKNFLRDTKIDLFVASPLTRTRQTMGHLLREFDLPENRAESEPAMLELAFGIWEGHFFKDLKTDSQYPKNLEERFRWRPPDGESYEEGLERVRQWIGRIDGPTVIVAHGAIGRCLIGLVSDLPPATLIKTPTPQGHFCRLQDGRIDWFDTEGNPKGDFRA
ncbi:histidine phosphatase family protein [Taklimakanibacter deserti]|uniref:histidine phosphatase family protein n=1 Tax=Taklimakanibacter deserti TaxID=2267839 RepID=UPI0013C47236